MEQTAIVSLGMIGNKIVELFEDIIARLSTHPDIAALVILSPL